MFTRLLSASILLAAIPAFSQGPGGPGRPGMEHGSMGFAAFRTPVTNAPYSATFTTTTTEKLQDGTLLNSTTTRTVERDSLGRTREDVSMPARGGSGAPAKTHTMSVVIDPVAHTMTQLRVDQKVAVVHVMRQPEQGGHRGPAGNGDVATAGSATDRPHGRHEDKNVVKIDLGSKTIAGVVAAGTRTTRTIPAGEMGNAAPIVSTHEEWFSPDLKIELSRTDSDPFHGTRTTTTSALSKTEPDAALFQVPADYKVEQAPDRAGRRGFGGPRGGEMTSPATGIAPSPGM